MVYQANVLSVMIASPSDVIEQREDIRSIVNNWNFVNGFARSLILMPVGWETHSAPDLAGRPQGLINDRILADCDILIGVFWTRLGTPTGEFDSGTVEEISRHVEAGKPAMVYFSDAPVAPAALDHDQYAKVQDFKSWCFERGLVEKFTNSSEFRDKFKYQLDIQLNSNPYLKGILRNSVEKLPTAIISELSVEAGILLVAASEDANGFLLSISTLGGRHIQAGGKTFGEPGDPRSSAKWEAALRELVDLKYIIARGSKGESFQVTNAGYIRADNIREARVSD